MRLLRLMRLAIGFPRTVHGKAPGINYKERPVFSLWAGQRSTVKVMS
jgi:hypothetical protein